MNIKAGFNNKESTISIKAQPNGDIELWLLQPGLPEGKAQETLSYMTVEELRQLSEEIKAAIRYLFGI